MLLALVRRLAALATLAVAVAATPAQAEGRKLALVVGNAAYEHAPVLATPVADAQAMAGKLRDLGFEVTVLTDVGTAVFQAVLATFADQAKGAETVLFYYAGHAFQMAGVNHLVPVSARLDNPDQLGAETWTLDSVAATLKQDAAQLLVFVDACRDNPLPEKLRQSGTSEGLAQFDGGAGTFVSFATAPGQVAWDKAGDSANSPYTAALLARIEQPGQSLSDLMIAVRNDVFDMTGGRQTPWEQSSLRAQFYFNPGQTAPATTAASDDLPDFELVDTGAEVVAEEVVLAAAAIQSVDGKGKLRLQPLTSETRSLAVLSGVPVMNAARLAGNDAAPRAANVPPAADLPRAIQAELERIGCYGMKVDGDWGNGSRNAMRAYYKAKGSAEGEVEPTEAVFLALAAEPEKTCAEPAAVAAKKSATKTATKKKTTSTKKAASEPKAAAPAKKKGVECKFIGIAVICS